MRWAIGDLQGCFDPFMALLEKINFDPASDELWLVGDLVNRGNNSLETLDYVYRHRDGIKIVLGNHDIALIAAYYGIKKSNPFIEPILLSPNAGEYIEWLRSLPFLFIDENSGYCMSHAGIAPIFDLDDAKKWNDILQTKLQGDDVKNWLAGKLRNKECVLSYNKSFNDNEDYAFSSFTRMRYCFCGGELEMENKSCPVSDEVLEETLPWFNVKNRKMINKKIIFGHWSTLGLYIDNNVVALDTGCLWGGKLIAYNLDTQEIVHVECKKEI